MNDMKVLIADDHAIVRKGFREIVEESIPGVQVMEAINGLEVLEKIRVNDWDVLVMDISMPGRSGLDILHEIRAQQPKLPVLILSMHPEDQYAMRMLKAGAAGYINKEVALDQLVQAIHKVTAGGRYVSPTLAEKFAFELSGGSDKQPHELLSDREYTVLIMIGGGKTVSEIAEQLSLSVKTVSTYRTRILEKMNLSTNAEMIRYVIENNLS